MKYEERLEKYNEAMSEIATDVNPILERLYQKSTDLSRKVIDVDTRIYNPCGITKRITPKTPEELDDLNRVVDTLTSDIIFNPEDYPLAVRQAEVSTGAGGSGRGDERQRVMLEQITYPAWLDEIDETVGSYMTKAPIRKGLDYEELVKGQIAKARQMSVNEADALYVILDTSGSMWNTGLKNSKYTFLEILVAYFPHIASKYSGQIWMIDDLEKDSPLPPNAVYELDSFKGSDMSESVALSGGGGTEFWGAFQIFEKKLEKAKLKDPEAKLTCILMTDLGVDLESHPSLVPEDLIVVSYEGAEEYMDRGKSGFFTGSRKLILMK